MGRKSEFLAFLHAFSNGDVKPLLFLRERFAARFLTILDETLIFLYVHQLNPNFISKLLKTSSTLFTFQWFQIDACSHAC